MRKRLFKVLLICFIALICGLFYAFLTTYGIEISCKFNDITRLKCTGCGVSRMCLSLLDFDFKSAFYYNFGIMSLSPAFIFLSARTILTYIKTGKFHSSKIQDKIIIAIIAYLVLYTILRNIPYFGIF